LEIPRIDRYTVRQWRDEEIRTLRSRQKPFLEVDQIRILLGLCGPRDRLLVSLMTILALRPSEAFGLSWDAIVNDGADLAIRERVYRRQMGPPKTESSEATLPVPPRLQTMLTEHRATHPKTHYVFESSKGTPLDKTNWLNRYLRPRAKLVAEFSVTPQVLRRTFATLAPRFGASLKTVEAVLRHSASLNFTTGEYIQQVRPDILKVLDQFADTTLKDLVDLKLELPESFKPATGELAEVLEANEAKAGDEVQIATRRAHLMKLGFELGFELDEKGHIIKSSKLQ
jgi:integrase